ncbi:MAG: hypothetical protein BWY79_02191 [Actinobacteria bacterium ADurb.Bin444]|nr:MAG: hypothetical protein BWY79_02191 [Actinobacteria bacterium ADurb.Bin444]
MVAMPTRPSRALITGPNTSVPAPNPKTAKPVIVPRLSGNHFTQVAMGVT